MLLSAGWPAEQGVNSQMDAGGRLYETEIAARICCGSHHRDPQAQFLKLLDRAREAHSRFDGAKPFWNLPRQRIVVPPQSLSVETVSNPSMKAIEAPHTSKRVTYG